MPIVTLPKTTGTTFQQTVTSSALRVMTVIGCAALLLRVNRLRGNLMTG
jgi:hypothetical protein